MTHPNFGGWDATGQQGYGQGYGQQPAPAYDPRDQWIGQLTAERDAALAEVKKLRRTVRRSNIAGAILIAIWLFGVVSLMARGLGATG